MIPTQEMKQLRAFNNDPKVKAKYVKRVKAHTKADEIVKGYKFDNTPDDRGKPKHLHVLDGKPLVGTTTALGILMKVLTWWASGLAMAEFGWIKKLDRRNGTKEDIAQNEQDRLAKAKEMLEQFKGMEPEEYVAKLDAGYKAHSVKLDKSATAGTDMHAELEHYVKAMIADNKGIPIDVNEYGKLIPLVHEAVAIFAAWAKENVKRFLAAEGHAYSERLWTGSIFDVLYEDKEGRIVILDHKSAKEAYFSHFLQDAGCDIAIEENGVLDAEGNLILKLDKKVAYYGVFPFGMKNPVPQFHFDTEGARQGFEAAVSLYKLDQAYKNS